jgi:hypothetical protein
MEEVALGACRPNSSLQSFCQQDERRFPPPGGFDIGIQAQAKVARGADDDLASHHFRMAPRWKRRSREESPVCCLRVTTNAAPHDRHLELNWDTVI